jgi:hypothetical protein
MKLYPRLVTMAPFRCALLELIGVPRLLTTLRFRHATYLLDRAAT